MDGLRRSDSRKEGGQLKDETKEKRVLQNAISTHARSLEWILARLHKLGARPVILRIVVTDRETLLETTSGDLHGPAGWRTLGELWKRAAEEAEAVWKDAEETRRKVLASEPV